MKYLNPKGHLLYKNKKILKIIKDKLMFNIQKSNVLKEILRLKKQI